MDKIDDIQNNFNRPFILKRILSLYLILSILSGIASSGVDFRKSFKLPTTQYTLFNILYREINLSRSEMNSDLTISDIHFEYYFGNNLAVFKFDENGSLIIEQTDTEGVFFEPAIINVTTLNQIHELIDKNNTNIHGFKVVEYSARFTPAVKKFFVDNYKIGVNEENIEQVKFIFTEELDLDGTLKLAHIDIYIRYRKDGLNTDSYNIYLYDYRINNDLSLLSILPPELLEKTPYYSSLEN